MAYTGTTVSFIFQCADVDWIQSTGYNQLDTINWIQSTKAKFQLQKFCEYSNEHLGCMIAGFCCGVNDSATLLG